jgi:hypothetical protein
MGVTPRPSGTSIYPDRATREADVRAIVEFITSSVRAAPETLIART